MATTDVPALTVANRGRPPGVVGPIPLVALLGRARDAFTAEFDRRLVEAGFVGLSLAHSRNVLRWLGGGAMRASRIAEGCDVSKQAVSQQIAHLEASGYLSVAPDPTDQRARILSLTSLGQRAQECVEALFVEIEGDWRQRVGEDELRQLRRLLEQLDDSLRDADQTDRC